MYSGLIMVKKGKDASYLPLKWAYIYLTVKTPGSWKTKTIQVIDLSLENHGAKGALMKLLSFSQVVSIS